jgi:hypothetical protein
MKFSQLTQIQVQQGNNIWNMLTLITILNKFVSDFVRRSQLVAVWDYWYFKKVPHPFKLHSYLSFKEYVID